MSFDILPTLPLDTFRELIGMNPFWFWGMSDDEGILRPGAAPGLQGCRGIVKEYAWQDRDEAGRSDIRKAIARAEKKLETQLKFYPGPVYLEETLDWPRMGDPRFIRSGPYDADGRWLNVKLSTGWVQAIGVEARTTVKLGASVTYVDDDEDGYFEAATIGPIATTETNAAQIALYVSANDRVGTDITLSERWRISPITASISGGFLTIRAPAWIFVPPKLVSGVNAPDLNARQLASFLQSVDIYRRYTETNNTSVDTSQGVIIWETRPWHGWWCFCSSCQSDPFSGSPDDPAATARAAARVGIRNAKRGVVTPAEALLNVTTGVWAGFNWDVCEQPDRVTVRYLAGYPLDSDGQMNARYRELVAILAAAELGRPISGCAEANRLLFYWQQDLAQTGNDRDMYATSADVIDNPFGTRRGHVYAWRQVVSLARGEGIRAG